MQDGADERYCGHVEVILGPMFSGKSTELLRRMRRYQCAGLRCLLIKYRHDVRYSPEEAVFTHDRQSMEALPCERLADLSSETELCFDCIGIDEGQFFPDLVPWTEARANAGKVVIVAALDGDFQRRPFGSVLELIPLAEDVCKLTAVCLSCHKPASFSQRLVGSTPAQPDLVVDIGGSDKYRAVCRRCFFRPTEAGATAEQATGGGAGMAARTSPVARHPSPGVLSRPTFSPR